MFIVSEPIDLISPDTSLEVFLYSGNLASSCTPPAGLSGVDSARAVTARPKSAIASSEDIFIAGEGEIVDRRYKVLRITPTSVEIEDVLNSNRQMIPLTQG